MSRLCMIVDDLYGGFTGFPIITKQAPLTSFTSWIWWNFFHKSKIFYSIHCNSVINAS